MYFAMFIIFMALIIAPSVVGPTLDIGLQDKLPDNAMIQGLFQPNPVGYEAISSYHNDTGPIRKDILESESSVLSLYEATKSDGGAAPKATGDSSDSSDSGSGGDDTSSTTPEDTDSEGVNGSDEEGFSGRKLVRLL